MVQPSAARIGSTVITRPLSHDAADGSQSLEFLIGLDGHGVSPGMPCDQSPTGRPRASRCIIMSIAAGPWSNWQDAALLMGTQPCEHRRDTTHTNRTHSEKLLCSRDFWEIRFSGFQARPSNGEQRSPTPSDTTTDTRFRRGSLAGKPCSLEAPGESLYARSLREGKAPRAVVRAAVGCASRNRVPWEGRAPPSFTPAGGRKRCMARVLTQRFFKHARLPRSE